MAAHPSPPLADKIDFMRDIIAYMVVLVLIVGVSLDGKVGQCGGGV